MITKSFPPQTSAYAGRVIFHGPLVATATPASQWTVLPIDTNDPNATYVGHSPYGSPWLDVTTYQNFRFSLDSWAQIEMNLSFSDPAATGLVGFRYTPWVDGAPGAPVIQCQSAF